MQTYVMFAGAEDVIHNDPASAGEPAHHPPVFHTKASVAVVLTFKAVRMSAIRRRVGAALSLPPVNPEETPSPTHLVVAIDRHSVADRGARESIVPRRLSIVEISSGVPSQVEAAPPQVYMQLISLNRPPSVAARADERPRTIINEAMVTSVAGRELTRLRFFSDRRLATEPQSSLIPRPRP